MNKDIHSFSNPEQTRVKHLNLEVDVSFEYHSLAVTAILEICRIDASAPLIVDTRDLTITTVQVSTNGSNYSDTHFAIGPRDDVLGAALSIYLPGGTTHVLIKYNTSPHASGLQWLEPSQTTDKQAPFVYTQSQTIHARSWIPIQDSPGIRFIYSARVRTPQKLSAVMSANKLGVSNGEHKFEMPEAIPSYLVALAVGDLSFRATGPRTGVYAEPSVLDRAASEFADTEEMICSAERLYGPYRWGRYDLLILPSSFPLGGMENPRVNFVTPTVLAGDKSLVSIIAHELAHSWSGNLVSNATWSDFWLNEGFTVYVERRILEDVYGKHRAEMEEALGRQDLEAEIGSASEMDTVLYPNLEGKNPDKQFRRVPYEKGALFLKHLELTFGRERFDQFLREYFNHFAFQSITTAAFASYAMEHLLNTEPNLSQTVPFDAWINQPGLPASAPRPITHAFTEVSTIASQWMDHSISASDIPMKSWTTHEKLHFLRSLSENLNALRMEELDKEHDLTGEANAEIQHQWLLLAIKNSYQPALANLETHLTSIGRFKLIRFLYKELMKTAEGQKQALMIYERARPNYHPMVATMIDEIVGWTLIRPQQGQAQSAAGQI